MILFLNGKYRAKVLAFQCFKSIVVVGAGCAHPFVPPTEVEAVVALKILVVLVMIDRGIEPTRQKMTVEMGRIQLPTQMTIDVIDGHKYQKSQNNVAVERQNKRCQDKNASLYKRLSGLKSKRCPGRWVGRFVMYQMK